jgi:hypothetical protein
MPCDGITVLMATVEEVEEAIKTIGVFSAPWYAEANGTVKMDIVIPLPGGGVMPAKVAIEENGKITAITQSGTYEIGVEALKQMILALQTSGVSIDDINFESHSHEMHAPQMAYSQSSQH